MRRCLNVPMSATNVETKTSAGIRLRVPGPWQRYALGGRADLNTQANSSNLNLTLRNRGDTVDG